MWRQKKHTPFLMAAGIGLSISNSKPLIGVLAGVQSSFVRTPKCGVEVMSTGWEAKKYVRKRAIWVTFVVLALAVYFILTTVCTVTAWNYFPTPLLFLFSSGYVYMGAMSLFQTPLLRARALLRGLVRARGPDGTAWIAYRRP